MVRADVVCAAQIVGEKNNSVGVEWIRVCYDLRVFYRTEYFYWKPESCLCGGFKRDNEKRRKCLKVKLEWREQNNISVSWLYNLFAVKEAMVDRKIEFKNTVKFA